MAYDIYTIGHDQKLYTYINMVSYAYAYIW